MHPNGVESSPNPQFLLHTYYKSSCSGRLRIALNLKGLQAKYVYVNLFQGDQLSDKYKELNPSGTAPVLTHLDQYGHPISFPITQSAAALEYLEEVFPDPPLLPPASKTLDRARVRTLVNIITNDIQPFANRRVVSWVTELGSNRVEWNKYFMTRGLEAYDKIAAKTAGKYSVGDEVTMADVCLLPAIYAAEKNEVELQKMPTIMRVYEALSQLEAVREAHWSLQKDCPADMSWL
jgi:maleylacetoacetate isomerase